MADSNGRMSDAEIGCKVKDVVREAHTPLDAMEKLRVVFPESSLVWVKTMRPRQWKVLLRPTADSPLYSFICDRVQ